MIKIKNLLGHNHVDIACQCLGSLLRYCDNPIEFVIHDDGSLTAEDISKLSQVLKNIEIIDRKTANESIKPYLDDYPECKKYRERHPLGLKLFDVCLLHPREETLYFCDSDVLFLRPFRFPENVAANKAIFMQDSHQAFSIRPWHVKPFGPVGIMNKINTGLIITRNSNLDLDYVESFLSNKRLQTPLNNRPHWVEQTCWASLASRLSAYVVERNQICLASDPILNQSMNQVAIHFVSSHREELKKYIGNDRKQLEACDLVLEKATKLSPASLFYDDFARRFNLH